MTEHSTNGTLRSYVGSRPDRETNAYVGVCTECGLEDSLPVSNAAELPEIGETLADYVCDCGNTAWEVTGYDRLVFQRESRFERGPDISGTYHDYGRVEWTDARDAEYPHPVCPVSQLGCTDSPRGCWRTADRLTTDDGRGAWKCPWHGAFRIFNHPKDEAAAEAEQTTLGEP